MNDHREALLATIFDDGSRALANSIAPDLDLMLARDEGALMLAFAHLAQQAIEDVYADCGDTAADVLASNVGSRIARNVHEVLFGEPDGVLRDENGSKRYRAALEQVLGWVATAGNTPDWMRLEKAEEIVIAALDGPKPAGVDRAPTQDSEA